MSIVPLVLVMTGLLPAKVGRIDLAQSARVVRYEGDTAGALKPQSLTRGTDGYEAWTGPDGQYMIGVEWDAPRDLAEVNIEFRHAIANREEIRVQYWDEGWPATSAASKPGEPPAGRWVTARADWWAGDRDVTFAFVPLREERPGPGVSDVTYRRTRRLRYLLGKEQLPPVRYLKAYGPDKAAEATFALSFAPSSRFHPPLDAEAVNGHLLEDEEGKTTTTQTTQVEKASPTVGVRYALTSPGSPNTTRVTLRDMLEPTKSITFVPVEVIRAGQQVLDDSGVTVRCTSNSAASKPSA